MKTPSISFKNHKRNENSRYSMPTFSWSMTPSFTESPVISVTTPSHNSSLRSIPSYETDLISNLPDENLKSIQEQVNLLSRKLIFVEQTLFEWKTEFYDLQYQFQEALNEHSATRTELERTRRMLQESEHVRARWYMKNTSSIVLNHQLEAQEADVEESKSSHRASLRSLSKMKMLRFFKAQP